MPESEITISRRWDDKDAEDGYRWRIGYDTGVLTDAGYERVKAAIRYTIQELDDEDRGYVLRDDGTEMPIGRHLKREKPKWCRCGYPASSQQDLDEHVLAITAGSNDPQQHGER